MSLKDFLFGKIREDDKSILASRIYGTQKIDLENEVPNQAILATRIYGKNNDDVATQNETISSIVNDNSPEQ